MSDHNQTSVDKQGSISAFIARTFWMMFGNIILMICAASILTGKNKQTAVPDVIFWCTAIVMIIVRYIDVKILDGLTATGKPANMRNWIKYAIMLVVLSGAIWTAARAAVYFSK